MTIKEPGDCAMTYWIISVSIKKYFCIQPCECNKTTEEKSRSMAEINMALIHASRRRQWVDKMTRDDYRDHFFKLMTVI